MRLGRRPDCPLRLQCSLLFWLCWLAPLQLAALSLGDAEVLSALGDPIEVEIAVEDWGGIDPQTIEASLAERSQYQGFGLDWLPVLDDLNFNLIGPRLDGSLNLLVSTREPVSEPYVELLLALRWPGGSLLREYVLLFDLPESRQEVSLSVATALPSGRRRYQVHAGEVFWNIGQQFLVAGEDASLHQMLLALYELNPGAFINDNISLLRADALLQIPTAADLQDVDASTAQQRFDELWTAGTRALREPEPAFPELSPLSADLADSRTGAESAAAMNGREPGMETGRERPPGTGWLLPANTPVIMPWRDDQAAAEQEGSLLVARQKSIDTLARTRSLGSIASQRTSDKPALSRLSVTASSMLISLSLQAERRARLHAELQESQARLEEALLLTARINAALEAALAERAAARQDSSVDILEALALLMLGALLVSLGMIGRLLLSPALGQARARPG